MGDKEYPDIQEIISRITKKYQGLKIEKNWGEIGLFYNPENKLKKGIYVVTFKEKDGANDSSSNLSRKDHFRMNVCISKKTFLEFFGQIPQRPPAGGIVSMDYDFSETDTILPHPVYSWMSWVCVINPSFETLKRMDPLIDEAYDLSLMKYKKKKL